MFYRLAVITFMFNCPSLFGQSLECLSISVKDTLINRKEQLGITDATQQLDSIQAMVCTQYNLLKNSSDSIMKTADSAISRLNSRIDSLRNRNLPTDIITNKLDSINRWKDQQLKIISTKVEKLKLDVHQTIGLMKLPPQLLEQASGITSTVDKFDISLPNFKVPPLIQNADLSAMSATISSGLGIEIPSIESSVPIAQLREQLPQVPATFDDVAKLAEDQGRKNSAIGDIHQELGQVGDIKSMAGTLKDQDAMKRQMIQRAQQQAMDHFEGKEEQLQQAMQTLAKYKQKYHSLESLTDIPKRRPNEMKGRPTIERLVPGITLQIFRKDDWMVDFNPYVGYRFNTRLIVGAGWNERIGYDAGKNQFDPDLRVYGPRSYGEFKIGEGFSANIQIEYMNTFVPPIFSSGKIDEHGHEWVFSTMAGMKKEYRFFKNVKGTFYMLYNLHDPHHRSPYADKLNMRLGFEFPMKKKP